MTVILLGKSSRLQNLCQPERHVTPEITADSLKRAPNTAGNYQQTEANQQFTQIFTMLSVLDIAAKLNRRPQYIV